MFQWENVNVMLELDVNYMTFQWFTIGLLSKFTQNVNIELHR